MSAISAGKEVDLHEVSLTNGGAGSLAESVAALEFEERVARNNLFVESRAMVLMVMREWRVLLEKYKERHPDRFAHEGGYCRPPRFALVSATSATALGVTDFSRPSTAAANAGRPMSTASSRRIGFADNVSGSSVDQLSMRGAHQNQNTLSNNHRSGSAKSNRSQFVMHNPTTGASSISTYNPSSGYRAPANLRERTRYIYNNTVSRPLETFTADDIDKDYNLKEYLANPDAYEPKRCGEKELVLNDADFDDDEEPIIDPEAQGNNDSDREDYDLDELEMLTRDVMFGDKHTRAARKQGDWDLFELKSRELRRALAEEEAELAVFAEASQTLEGRGNMLEEENESPEKLSEENEDLVDSEEQLTPLQLRARAVAASISAPRDLPFVAEDRPATAGTYATISNKPRSTAVSTTGSLSGNPGRALARLRIPSRKYYNRQAKRASREAEERLLKAMEDLEAEAERGNVAIRATEVSQRRVFESLALERAMLTAERIRQLEWDRHLGSQQNVVASEEMFLRATYWQEERATRYNVYHWFDDTFEQEIDRIRLRMIEDEKEIDRKIDYRKELEDAEAKKEYERLCKRNQKIAHLQNQRVIQLRRNRIERERWMNIEFSDRQFLQRDEVDAIHLNPHPDVGMSLDEYFTVHLLPHQLEVLLTDSYHQKAIMWKEDTRGEPYDIAPAVGEAWRDFYHRYLEERAQAKLVAADVDEEMAAKEQDPSAKKDIVALAVSPAPETVEDVALMTSDETVQAPQPDERGLETIEPSDSAATGAVGTATTAEEDSALIAASKAAATDKDNYTQFLTLVDEKLPLAVKKDEEPGPQDGMS
eukprot:GILI01012693.1.p1 GENE.GILI01012693.1~~GILI01012693.1.p1  ORF type:complete len:900 (+),score=206.87 GILI01012693.1:226-2700(+)